VFDRRFSFVISPALAPGASVESLAVEESFPIKNGRPTFYLDLWVGRPAKSQKREKFTRPYANCKRFQNWFRTVWKCKKKSPFCCTIKTGEHHNAVPFMFSRDAAVPMMNRYW